MMKPIQTVILGNLIRSKSLYLFLLAVGVFALRAVIHVHNGFSRIQSGSSLFDLYYGVLSDRLLEMLYIPFFLLLLGITSDVFDSYKVLLKYESAKQWWKEKMIASVLFSAICAGAILLILVVAYLVSGHFDELDRGFLWFLLLGLLLQWIGFSGLAALYQLMVLRFSQKYVGFFVSMFIVFLIDLFKTLFKLKFTTPQEYMSLVYKWNADQVAVGTPDLIPIFFLGFVFVVLYVIGMLQAQDKDFYWSE